MRKRFIDLSHAGERGMTTYPGLPAPLMRDYLSREESRRHYAEETEFRSGKSKWWPSAIEARAFEQVEVRGQAVLVDTGWSRHRGTEAYTRS